MSVMCIYLTLQTDEYYIDPDAPHIENQHKHIPPEVKAQIICREIGETKLHKAARLGYEVRPQIVVQNLEADCLDNPIVTVHSIFTKHSIYHRVL